ncbi:MAG: DMT family transporter, partial [Pseudomonadota bacterium]
GAEIRTMTTTRSIDITIVLFCALMWGLWWYPVSLFEEAGLSGAWVGLAMCGATLPIGLIWSLFRKGTVSPRGILGGVLIGAAFMLYSVSVSYTDFIRAVLLFYLAPAWSTIIELVFLGRRWNIQCVVAIGFSLIGVLMISRGEISFDGLGAIGDWMALASGVFWSAGTACVFSSRRAEVSRVMIIAALGGMASAYGVSHLDSATVSVPDFPALMIAVPSAFLIAAAYVGTMMAGTMWGAFRLPPAVMTYLLSLEILGGVFSAVFILGETFGWFEAAGALFIIGAVLVEVLFAPKIAKAAP